MNNESFRYEGQDPEDHIKITEFPSFEEHMQKLQQHRAETQDARMEMTDDQKQMINENFMAQSSLKYYQDKEGLGWLPGFEGTQKAIKKIQKGEPLSSDDIFQVVYEEGRSEGSDKEQFCEFLENIGVSKGSNFDILRGGVTYDEDGLEVDQPLGISFKNHNGSYTKVTIDKNGEATAAMGLQEEGYDVGYNGKGRARAVSVVNPLKKDAQHGLLGTYNPGKGQVV